jgi:flagellar protein FlbD
MIHLTRINRIPLVLNSDLIEHVERTPDTVVSLVSGLKLLVLETPDEIVEKIVQFRRAVLSPDSSKGYPAFTAQNYSAPSRVTKNNLGKGREE